MDFFLLESLRIEDNFCFVDFTEWFERGLGIFGFADDLNLPMTCRVLENELRTRMVFCRFFSRSEPLFSWPKPHFTQFGSQEKILVDKSLVLTYRGIQVL